MDIYELLRSAEGRNAMAALAAAHGIQPHELDTVLAQVVPALSARIERNTLSRGGLSDLLHEIGDPTHARVLADPAHVTSGDAAQTGIGALETILGSKAASRSVAANAAMSTGISQAIIQKLLPIIASLVIAALSKGAQGGLGDILKKLPDFAGAGGGAPARAGQRQTPHSQDDGHTGGDGGLGDIFSKIPGLPGGSVPNREPQSVPSFPTGTSGPFGGGSPLPIPGDRIPGVNAPANDYGNLPDIVRRGGQSIDGTSLGTAVRNVLGSVLGFQSKGFLGWAIRLILLRWGWGFLQRILARILTGR